MTTRPDDVAFEPRRRSRWVALYERARPWTRRLGLGPPRTAGAIVERAAARAGTRAAPDVIDALREPLRAILSCADADPSLSPFGRDLVHAWCVAAIEKRLRVEALLARHPAIREERVDRPIFVVGLPRTGSTHLHHLLASIPAARAPIYWQVRWPTPPPVARLAAVDPRRWRAEAEVRRGLRAIPTLRALHTHGADAPEECQFLLDASLMNPLLPLAPAYLRWWREQDLRPAYRVYREQLQILQHRWPGRPWVLKAPFHLWHLDALLDVFRDARFVWTHRDPLEVVASAASYAAFRSRAFFPSRGPAAIGAQTLDELSALAATGLAHRARVPPERVLDVEMTELVRRPLELAEAIARAFDIPLDAAARAALERYVEAHPRHAHGRHVHDLARFGLDEAAVCAAFAPYARFCASRGLLAAAALSP